MVQIIKGLNARLLQSDKATEDWKEVNDAVAREKLGLGFVEKQRIRDHHLNGPVLGGHVT